MRYKLLFSHHAQIDIAEASIWYSQQRKGLGNEFLLNLEAEFYEISLAPNRYPIIKNITGDLY